MRAARLNSYAGAGRSGIFIRTGSAPVRPLTALQNHRAGLPPVRGRAPPLDLIGSAILPISLLSQPRKPAETRTDPRTVEK